MTIVVQSGTLRNQSPLQIQPASLEGWWDASDSATITIGSGVSQWNDKSGNARHVTQGTTTRQPSYTGTLNSLNVITAASGGKVLNNTTAAMLRGVSGYTMFGVAEQTLVGATSSVIVQVARDATNLTRGQLHVSATAETIGTQAKRANADTLVTVINTPTGADRNVWAVWSMRADFSTTVLGFYKNGTLIASDTGTLTSGVSPSDFGAVGIMGRPDGSVVNGTLQGAVGEVVVYGAALSDADHASIVTYLRNRWGL